MIYALIALTILSLLEFLYLSRKYSELETSLLDIEDEVFNIKVELKERIR